MNAADTFFELHHRARPLVLCNAWDAFSARLFEAEGFEAIATSSSGVANSLGYADGECVDSDQLFASLRNIVRVVRVPVSVDLEAGFGLEPGETARTVERAIDAGAVGCNLEDYDPRQGEIMSIETQCARIRAVKARCEVLGVRFFVNARTDLMLKASGDAATRVDRTIERLRAYAGAGADGAFAPGVGEAADIERIAGALEVPFNALARPGSPSIAEMGRLGVARVSLGSWPSRVAMGAAQAVARELRANGTYGFVSAPTLSYDESNALFARPD